MLVQKNLNELGNICSFFHLPYALSFMYSGIYFSQTHTLPLKSLAILTFHNMKYDILSVISYCTLNKSALIFIVLGLLSQVNFCMYLLFRLCYTRFFCQQAACGRQEDDFYS